MQLYGHPMSTCTRKVLCVLAEKEEKADFHLVDLFKGEQKAPEHLARQPYGQIPVLEDGDFRLFESRAIMRYVAEKYANKGTRLIPADVKAKALMEQQISVESSNFTPNVMKVVVQEIFTPMRGGQPDKKVIDETLPLIDKVLDIYEQFLTQHKFLGGDEFTIADIGNATYFEYFMQTSGKALVEKHPKVLAWWNAVSSRPSWKKAVGKA